MNPESPRPAADGGAQSESVSVLTWADEQHLFLTQTFDALLVSPDRKHVSRCLYLAHKIQSGCKHSPEGVLAALHLNRTARYQHVKELFAGVLCELLGQKVGMTPSARLLLICAALTQDIGMLDLQDEKLDKQVTALTDQQKRIITKHPHNGRQILERAGVKDSVWLSAVEQHHERPDGNGYPQALTAEAISQPAKLLSVADIYVAMMRPRGDRPAMFPREAMKQVFLARGHQVDNDIARQLIEVIGMHPPGIWVKLINGEVGVVVAQGSTPAFPRVATVLSHDGEHLGAAVIRDTSQRSYTLVEAVTAPFHFNLSAILADLWPRLPA
ncbi:HD-GYP domain-containing protein [Motiliproteus sediminis]|uniref:HD-GYP domain-containing protein n=1 Tax=Motiliproteus sediminis TaxID=1468178 RepID=UPI001AEFA0E4|nr:HD domain-containing phosphohydrolase [Motiliproteus sediminis]